MSEHGIRVALVSGLCTLLLGAFSVLTPSTPDGYLAQVIDYTTDGTTQTTTYDSAYTNDTLTTTDSSVATYETSPTTYVEPTTTTDQTYLTNTTTQTIDTSALLETLRVPPCPFSTGSGIYIIDFSRGGTAYLKDALVVANKDTIAARKSIPISVPTGLYEVQLASFDAHRSIVSVAEYREQWFLELYDASAGRIVSTPPARDIADTEEFVKERVMTTLLVGRPVAKALAIHAAFPNSVANGVAPVCAQLKRVGDAYTTATVSTTTTTSIQTTTPDTTTTTVPVAATTTYTTTSAVTATTTTLSTTTAVPSDFLGKYATCPMLPKSGRTVVDFTRGGTVSLDKLLVRADGEKTDAIKGPLAAYLAPGSYDIQLASLGGSVSAMEWGHEEWHALLFDGTGAIVGKTPPSRDIPEWHGTAFVSGVAKGFEVKTGVARIGAFHNAYGSGKSEQFAVLCASFDRVETSTAVTTEETVSTAAIENTITNTVPVTNTAPVATVPNTSIPEATVPTSIPKPAVPVSPPYVPQTGVMVESGTASGTVRVAPAELGVQSALREVAIPQQVLEQRRAIVEGLQAAPFETLQKSGQQERRMLMEKLLSPQGEDEQQNDSATSSDRAPRVSLARMSEEELPRVEENDAAVDAERTVQREKVVERTGLSTYRDTDGDGVSDYDETNVYGTDPENPFTGGSVLTDGERLLMGLDPQTDDVEPVIAESPRVSGETAPELFSVETIELVSTEAETSGTATATPVRIAGTAQPLSFVTIYIYSTPIIVTVRADSNGKFEYTLDTTLEDGTHELYVASVNNSGKVLAKSDPLPFVKTAEAVEYTPASIAANTSPVESSMLSVLTFGLLAMLAVAVGSIVLIGVYQSRRREEGLVAESQEPHAGV